MTINSRTVNDVQTDVTSLTTNETNFRDGLDDVIVQVNATEEKLSEVSTADLIKLNDVTATAIQLNTLDGITATVDELNQLDGATITPQVLTILGQYSGTVDELNILDGITATQDEINKLDGFTGDFEDLNKIASVTSSANDLNALDGFVDTHSGTLGDLVRCIQLDDAGNGTEGQVLTSSRDDNDNFQFSWTTPSSFTFTLEDEDGTEISIDTDEIKVVGYTTTDDGQGNITTTDGGIDIKWGPGDGTDGNPYLLEITNTDKGSDVNAFKNIAVSGQTTIAADSDTDTLTLAAGTGISLATDATTDTLTITGTAAANNATITISGDVTADSTFTVDQSSDATITLSLNAGVVDTTEIADNAVTGAKILNATITGSKLANTTVTGSKLAYDRRANVYAADIYSGNLYDYTHYDDDVGIRWFIDNGEEMRLEKDGDLHVDGDVVAYSTTVSDERLKKDIQKVENGLDKVCQLSGYTFKYIDNDRQSAGVIAQEVEKVLPEAVVEKKLPFDGLDQDTEYKVVNYASLHSLMIEAIKELKAEIEDLKSKIK